LRNIKIILIVTIKTQREGQIVARRAGQHAGYDSGMLPEICPSDDGFAAGLLTLPVREK
jgi:hypothetical protein